MTAPGQSVEPRIAPEYIADMMRWRESAIVYGNEVLGLPEYLPGRIVTPDQEDIINAVRDYRRVAVTAANGVGKSYVLALIAMHFLVTNPNSWVITTSASWELVENVLWREIRDMYMKAKTPIGGTILNTSLEFGEKWLAIGLSTDNPTRFQGKHSGHVLIIGDESTGIDKGIFEASEFMALAPTDRLLFVGNPTDPSSDFYAECFNPKTPGKWHTLEISALRHPNVIYDRILIPGAVTREQVDDQLRFLGPEHPTYEARVLGRWPRKGGRMFPDWDVARHVYDPRKKDLPTWLPRWISLDWGFAHNAAALFWAFDGKMIYVEDEIVINEKTAAELGELVGMRANPQALYGTQTSYFMVALAHDMFARLGTGSNTASRTRAEEFDTASAPYGLPAGERAGIDRISGWNLGTMLMRTDALQVSSRCESLISKIPEAKRDPKKPEDMFKHEGDDELDAFYKGLLARPMEPQLPRELRISRQVTATDPHNRAMQARIAASREDAANDQEVVCLRRGFRPSPDEAVN